MYKHIRVLQFNLVIFRKEPPVLGFGNQVDRYFPQWFIYPLLQVDFNEKIKPNKSYQIW